jgi:hypothetical protein
MLFVMRRAAWSSQSPRVFYVVNLILPHHITGTTALQGTLREALDHKILLTSSWPHPSWYCIAGHVA